MDFGKAPGMFTFEPLQKKPVITKLPPIVPPFVPPDRPTGGRFSVERLPLDDDPRGFRFGGALNKGIMRLPQSQQGDTMTTQLFQRGFRPRR